MRRNGPDPTVVAAVTDLEHTVATMGWDSRRQERDELSKLRDAVMSAERRVADHERSAQYYADQVHACTVRAVEAEGELEEARKELAHHLEAQIQEGETLPR